MNRYNINSQASDTLDFLFPPVKRTNTAQNKEVPFVNSKNNPLKTFYENNITGIIAPDKTIIQPSTSLVSKKSADLRCSVINFPKASIPKASPRNTPKITRDQPLIKVTVIPKADQNLNTKLYRKRRHIPKKVQSSSSNQENSVQTNNVYLVLAGRRKKNIYEIRTTGSAEFFNNLTLQNKELSISDLRNFKPLVQSLNMDIKSKKNHKRSSIKAKASYIDGTKLLNDCTCTNVQNGIKPKKSRVRIYGQLDLTEDDKYVLQYGASVNDRPAISEINQLLGDFTAFPNADNDETNQRDSCVQADFELECKCPEPIGEFGQTCKGSKGTQVNFNINFASINRSKVPKFPNCVDKKIQCSCYNSCDSYKEKNKENNLNGCQSPLVVISVYPKQNLPDSVKTETDNRRRPVKFCNQKSITDKGTEKQALDLNRKEIKRPVVSRSLSPSKKPSKPRIQENKHIDNTPVRCVKQRERKSPGRLTALKAIKDKIQQEKTIAVTNQKRSNFINSTTKPQMLRNQSNAKKSSIRSQDIGTNTDHLHTKKALVDSYTKKLSAHMNLKRQPKINSSKVAINIEGDKEDFDVLFNQKFATTELKVRKQLKDMESQKLYEEERRASVENLLLVPDMKARSRSLSLALCDNQLHCGAPLNEHVSRLTIKDSLEIFHRREDKPTYGIKNTQTYYAKCDETNTQDTEFLAPIKHYIGDDCSIYDPITRDREIKKLLGVDKHRACSTKTEQEFVFETNNPTEYYNRKCCDKSTVTGGTLSQNNKITDSVQCNNPYRDNNINNIIDNKQISTIERTSVYQQLVLNRNIQVFLQVEQFAKPKPIVLTQKHYAKFKRAIQNTSPKSISHQKYKHFPIKEVSVGEIKKKKKMNKNTFHHKQVQTDICSQYKDVEDKIQDILRHFDTGYNRDLETHKMSINELKLNREKNKHKKNTNKIKVGANEHKDKVEMTTRRTVSSIEIHYANVCTGKHVTFSSNENVVSNRNKEKGNSLLTIFRGHRNSPTPNLGTSICSLCSAEYSEKSIKVLMEPRDPKRRKPFLKRLMSYLVMRSAKESDAKLDMSQSHPPTVDSSVDSYHISSSLAGVEVSSSLYDTSASFYSNHTIFPINSKIKKSFFSSVRGFIANRKN